MKISSFGFTKNKEEAKLYSIKNGNVEALVTDFGATLVKLIYTLSDGKTIDTILGYDDVTGYEEGDKYFGATIGINANRISNGSFVINDKEYKLYQNDMTNNLHSGPVGFDKMIWKVIEETESSISFLLERPDMDQGFPGKISVISKYSITADNGLVVTYKAVSDQDTIINMVNHSYFNLNGEGSGNVLGHSIRIASDYYTPVDEKLIPTGVESVKGTPFDLNEFSVIGDKIDPDNAQMNLAGGGFDHNYVIRHSITEPCAEVKGDRLKLSVYTDLPGIQFYAGNCIGSAIGKGGNEYSKQSGLCLETQFFPDSMNKAGVLPMFDSPVIKAGRVYFHETVYKLEEI